MDDTEQQLLAALRALQSKKPRPSSTYRVQLHAGFTFADTRKIVPYLVELGITHLYCSPILAAVKGSTHGYDVIDHNRLNPELLPEHFDPLCEELRQNKIGIILDIVPNHMGIATNDNRWWDEALAFGQGSKYANYFDINWDNGRGIDGRGKVVLPTLGGQYGDVLAAGELKLLYEAPADGSSTAGSGADGISSTPRLCIGYYDRRFPVSPAGYNFVLGLTADEIKKQPAASDRLNQLNALAERLSNCTSYHQLEEPLVELASTVLPGKPAAEVWESTLARINDRPADGSACSLLHQLLQLQNYRLCYWRNAPEQINYRRFFDINDLAAIRVEREDVFADSHRFIFNLLHEKKIVGLRLDHPDGLLDPAEYFTRLQRAYVVDRYLRENPKNGSSAETITRAADKLVEEHVIRSGTNSGGGESEDPPLYLLAEKILATDEPLINSWPIDGTSGYDFMVHVNALFVDNANDGAFTRIYHAAAGCRETFDDIAYQSKLQVLDGAMASELAAVTEVLSQLTQAEPAGRDFTLSSLRSAVRELVARFDIYRTYISDGPVTDRDRQSVRRAVALARLSATTADAAVYNFVEQILLNPSTAGAEGSSASTNQGDNETTTSEINTLSRLRTLFAGKLQQLTSPVTAKGVEDTAFYRYHRLISLNDVGGEPATFGIGTDRLHAYFADRQKNWPLAMSTLSTHDTKRSEDVRSRINVLSEMPDQWLTALSDWRQANGADAGGVHPNDAYLLYQTLIGSWPVASEDEQDKGSKSDGSRFNAYAERIKQYMTKALREGKQRSSWIDVDAEYEGKVALFIDNILTADAGDNFRKLFEPFVKMVTHFGQINTLAQTTLKFMAPGVPDTYQGTELPDFSLVDPDNRRPIDYELRQTMVRECRANKDQQPPVAEEASGGHAGSTKVQADSTGIFSAEALNTGRSKLRLTLELLQFRRRHPRLFADGDYLPVHVLGPRAGHAFAFARIYGDKRLIVCVPRLITSLCQPPSLPVGDVWEATRLLLPEELQADTLTSAITGRKFAMAASPLLSDLLSDAPVGVFLLE